MFRPLLHGGAPLAALACVLLAPQISLAQFHSFPGDWRQPGKGSGFGQSGFQRISDGLPFPYNGIDGDHGSRVVVQPAVPPPTQIYQPAPVAARALIRVRVPANASVFFDDSPTTQKGTDRLFTTPPLASASTYTYELTARWLVNGTEHTERRTIRAIPGQTIAVDFSAAQSLSRR